jgi:high-affinity iron transporter
MLKTKTRLAAFALRLFILAAVAGPATSWAQPASPDAEVRQTWKLLDYIAVDYPEAVENGAIINGFEYLEMQEFAATAYRSISALPENENLTVLLAQTEQLRAAIDEMAAPADVASLSRGVADSLLAAYPVPVAPTAVPDLARGAAVYAEQCASCHGLEGFGDGLAAEGLDPPPIAFTDPERARERSLFSLYEVVTQGLEETSMVSYRDVLSEEDRWAVAFYSGTLSFTPEQRQQGETLWQSDETLRVQFPNIEALARTTESGLASRVGAESARAAMAYLRSDASAVEQDSQGLLAVARARLAESLKAYEAGDSSRAGTLALSSYLDGFEPVEPMLRARDNALMIRVETAMIEYRSRIGANAPFEQVAAQKQTVDELFAEAERTLSVSAGDATAAFLGSFTILLREGLEALLVVVAMIGFLTKVDRRDVLPYVHAGWVSALLAGVATWAVAVYLVDISGANRELTEGFSALFAAVVLLGVGIWMHQKSLAGQWQAYIKDKMSAVLTRKSAFLLFALAFVVVYREAFETILFYVALWSAGNQEAILEGMAAAAVVLVLITVILLQTSRRLPIGQFFAASSALIAVLAFVLAGKGVAALEEAGLLPVITVDFPRIDWLGVYPSAMPLLAQAAVIVFLVIGVALNMRSARAVAAAE